MTQAQLWRPGTNPNPPLYPSERAFEKFLDEHRYTWQKESVRFELGAAPRGQSAKAVTPDYQILALPTGETFTGLFIELCEADRYTTRRALPLAVRTKNLKHSASKKAYISPAEYLARKRQRMQQAESLYAVRIMVLPYARQQAIFANPVLLEEAIEKALRSQGQLRRTS